MENLTSSLELIEYMRIGGYLLFETIWSGVTTVNLQRDVDDEAMGIVQATNDHEGESQ